MTLATPTDAPAHVNPHVAVAMRGILLCVGVILCQGRDRITRVGGRLSDSSLRLLSVMPVQRRGGVPT